MSNKQPTHISVATNKHKLMSQPSHSSIGCTKIVAGPKASTNSSTTNLNVWETATTVKIADSASLEACKWSGLAIETNFRILGIVARASWTLYGESMTVEASTKPPPTLFPARM